MQRELGGFTHRADKQQQAGDGDQIPAEQGAADHVGQVGEHVGIAQTAAEIGQHQTDAEHEAEVAHAVDQEGFQVGENRAVAFEIEADEQIRHQADRFPAEEKLDEVVRHNQHQHAEGKQ